MAGGSIFMGGVRAELYSRSQFPLPFRREQLNEHDCGLGRIRSDRRVGALRDGTKGAQSVDRYRRKGTEDEGFILVGSTPACVDLPQSFGRRSGADVGAFMQNVGAAWLMVSLG